MILATTLLSASCADDAKFEKVVRESVAQQIKIHPESTLRDLYKSFFQDRFGPGHIISNTDAARQYLLRELDSYTTVSGEMVEPTGWEHNFYRVNLAVIKKGFISSELLLDALVRSANDVEPVSVEKWREEWAGIEKIIRNMNLSLPDYDKDLAEITDKLQRGAYVGHHSETYSKAYDPHYRIISREIYEREIAPSIKSATAP